MSLRDTVGIRALSRQLTVGLLSMVPPGPASARCQQSGPEKRETSRLSPHFMERSMVPHSKRRALCDV